MIVVDANVILPYILKNEVTAAVHAIRRRDPVWRFPMLWRHEVASGLVKYVAAGLYERDAVARHYSHALRMLAAGELPVPDEAALALALGNGVSAYDAAYLALAQELGATMVTFDRALALKSKGRAVLVKDYLA